MTSATLTRTLFLTSLAVSAAACGQGKIGEAEGADDPVTISRHAALKHPVQPDKELFVTNLQAVTDQRFTRYVNGKVDTDPEGGWSFGRAMENMTKAGKDSSPRQRSQFILNWLKLWEQNQTINSQTVAARPAIRQLIIDPWKTASGCRGADSDCVLNMTKAPFRLEALVYRPDLRRLPHGSDPGNAGQGRMVFSALGASGNVLPFAIIFEYIIPISGTSDILAWAEKYHELGAMSFGSSFNDKLFNLTREFTKWNIAKGRPNGSAISQIRTNEIALDTVWELREFVLSPSGDRLIQDTVKNEPTAALNNSEVLSAYAREFETPILNGSIDMPLTYQGAPMLAGSALVPFGLKWNLPGVSEPLRRSVALNTCSGCHLSETGTPFLHVMATEVKALLRKLPPPTQREPAILSNFTAAELAGPRLWDFEQLLRAGVTEVEDGPGLDHNDDD